FVLCHPYPPYGGNMYHKVVVKAAELMLEEGFAVIRFNMRGTGKSTGETRDSTDARADLKSVLQWWKIRCPETPLWLGGFSYGAYICLSSLVPRVPGSFPSRFPVQGVLAIAYPASIPEYRLNMLPEVKMAYIHGTEDELIPPSALKRYLQSQLSEHAVQWVEGANHFFDGRLKELQEAVKQGLIILCCAGG
ncbi:MAG: alpha/beta hydrolase, partial [Planctomycetes bacterium]|nr:alpha/beta hydrolase [Planctomycetota bacterium]